MYISTSLELVKNWLDCRGSTYRIYSWNSSRRLWDTVHSLSSVHTCRGRYSYRFPEMLVSCVTWWYQDIDCLYLLGDLKTMVPPPTWDPSIPRKYHCDVSDRTSSDGCLSSKPMSFLVGVTYMLISSSCQPIFVLYRLDVDLYMIGCGFPYYVLVAIAICFILTWMDRCLPMDDGRFVEAFAGTSPWHSS